MLTDASVVRIPVAVAVTVSEIFIFWEFLTIKSGAREYYDDSE